MTEEVAAPAEPQEPQESPKVEPKTDGFEPITSQEEFDKRLAARLQRERAKFSDYDDLKSRAASIDKVTAEARQAGEKSAAEKFADKLFQAEVRARAVELGFHDPTDAIAQFGSRDGVVNGLDLDSDALSKRLTEVAEAKPYLLKSQPGPRVAQKPKLPGNDDKKQTKEPANGSRAAAALRAFSSNR